MLSEISKQKLSSLVKTLRGKLSRREFGRLYGVSYSSVNNWENGTLSQLPQEESLDLLARLTGRTVPELVSYLLNSEVSFEVKPVPEGRTQHAATVDADVIVALLHSLPPEDRGYVLGKFKTSLEWDRIEVAA